MGPCHPCHFLDSHQNFIDPGNPRDPHRFWTHVTHAPMPPIQPMSPCNPHNLADSLKGNPQVKYEKNLMMLPVSLPSS